MKKVKSKISLFFTGLIQVLLVVTNTYQVSHGKYIGAVLVGFLISMVWSFNVKKIAFGSLVDRLIYAFGASFGTFLGILISEFIYEKM